MMERNKLNGHIAIFVANVFFGLNNPISRTLMPEIIDPTTLTYFRMLGGAILFWSSAVFIKVEKVPFKDLVQFFFAAFFALTLNQLSFFTGLSKTSAIDATIVVSILPIVSMLLAAVIIKEPITFRKALGVAIGASGALFLILSKHGNNVGQGNITGNLIVIIAVCSFALYLTLFKNLISRYSVFTIMRMLFIFAVIQSYPFCHHALEAFDPSVLTLSVSLRIAYVVVIATFVSYILLGIGQRVLLPTTLSMYNYMQPIVASIAAVAIGVDEFSFNQLIAITLVFLGVYIVTQSKTRAQLEAEKLKKSVENTL